MKAAAPQVVGEQNILRKETHCRKKTNCSLPENWTACGKLMQTRVTANEGTDGLGSLSLKCHVEKKKNTLNLECVWMGVGDYWRFNGHYVCFWGKNKTKKLYSVFIYLFIVVVNWLNFSWTSPGRTECSDFLFLHSTCTYQEVVYTYHTCSFLHLTWRTEKPVEKKLTFKESSTRPLYLVFRCDHSCALDNAGHRNALENDIFLFLWLTLALTIHSP